VPDDGVYSVSVDLRLFGHIVVLQTRNSSKHTGILNNSELVNALYKIPLRLEATLLISEVKEMKELGKPKAKAKAKKHAPVKAGQEYSICIVLHGLWNDKQAVGDFLSDAGFFLQHPYTDEVIPEVQYDNPHYLARPGAEMPKLEHLSIDIVDYDSIKTETGDELRNSRLLQIFETAGANGETMAVVNMSPSPRLRSALMRYEMTSPIIING
jgi:hypothetical protein